MFNGDTCCGEIKAGKDHSKSYGGIAIPSKAVRGLPEANI